MATKISESCSKAGSNSVIETEDITEYLFMKEHPELFYEEASDD